MKHNHLKDIAGERIRRQYFNVPILLFISTLVMVFEFLVFASLYEGNFKLDKWMQDITGILTIIIWVVPFVVLSVLNRFFFGKIVCVLNEEGIHYKDGLIKWSDILSIQYNMTGFGHVDNRAYIEVVCKKITVQIKSVPLYMFSIVKKFNSDIKTKKDKAIWIYVAITIILPIIMPIILE